MLLTAFITDSLVDFVFEQAIAVAVGLLTGRFCIYVDAWLSSRLHHPTSQTTSYLGLDQLLRKFLCMFWLDADAML